MTAFHRRPGAASVTALGVITLTVATAHIVAPNWSHQVGLDVWRYSEYIADHHDCSEHRKDLEAEHDRLRQQIEVSDQIAILLIDRHVSLADAADEAARVNEDRSGFISSLGCTYRDAVTTRQRCSRYLISRVRLRLEETGESSRLVEIESRLEAEYRDLPDTP